jgi:hypothetical protein
MLAVFGAGAACWYHFFYVPNTLLPREQDQRLVYEYWSNAMAVRSAQERALTQWEKESQEAATPFGRESALMFAGRAKANIEIMKGRIAELEKISEERWGKSPSAFAALPEAGSHYYDRVARAR